jgi:hypothetical protein
MSSANQDLVYQSRRVDNATKIKRQAAANALQQYSMLALQAIKDCEVKNCNLFYFQSSGFTIFICRVQPKRDSK